MHAEDLLIDDGSDGELREGEGQVRTMLERARARTTRSNTYAVEAVGERLPELDVVAALALIVETVNA